MPGRMKQGQSIFIPFKDGESIYDSQNKARMYMSEEKFSASFPGWRFGEVDLVEYVPKPRWIRVEERLPENDGDMFLVLVTGQYNNIRFTDAYELAYYYQDDGWCLEQYPAYENPGVTHWLPLPEVP